MNRFLYDLDMFVPYTVSFTNIVVDEALPSKDLKV